MPVVALSERGLIIDVFGKKPMIVRSEAYRTSNNRLVSVYGSNVKFMDLLNVADTRDCTVPGFVDMQMSADGSKVLVLCYNKVLVVFDNGDKISEHTGIENFHVSDSFYSFSTKNSLKIFSFAGLKVLHESANVIKTIHCLNTFVIYVTEKSESQKVYMYKNEKAVLLLDLPNIYRTVLKASEDEMGVLLLIDTEYSKTSYYADSSLYLLKFGSCDPTALASEVTPANRSGGLAKSETTGTTKSADCDPQLVVQNDSFSLFCYRLLRKVHDFGFAGKSFYVCFGDQPAHLHTYTPEGRFAKKFPKAIRNRVVFNRKMSRVINAGLGNLPGNIEVFSEGVCTCRFECLGASVISWLNDGAHFMVSITDYFKSDNKITIYDYFGRAVEIMECKSLVNASVYGRDEEEPVVKPPAEIRVETVEQAYVPPHLKSHAPAGRTPILQASKKAQVQAKLEKRTYETVQKELEDCCRIKERMLGGEEISLEEENRMFAIRTLQEELSKLKKT